LKQTKLEITEEIIKNIKSDPRLFEIVYCKYAKEIYAYSYHLSKSQHMAEDLTSITFMKALEKISTFHGDIKKLRSWMYSICRNIFIDQIRREKKQVQGIEIELEKDENCNVAKEQQEDLLYEMLINEISRLVPPIYAEVLLLRYKQDLEIEQIAHIINKNESSVRTLVHRATNKLKAIINNQSLKLNCNP
jgi:RNA polymerase sigma factor (sigma-70 family)